MIAASLALSSLLLVASSSAASDAPRVDGLRAGETAVFLAPGPGPSDDYAHGRVIDAFTGAPLPGATIELWSEEIDEHYRGFHRFGIATSGRDGRFMVRHRDGARTAEKLRASAPGYLVYTETAAQANAVITLFPAESTAPRIRFEDLQGRSIQGARVTSTYTCAHDIPAFEYVSDANGVVVLEGYGLQDAIPELRVLAPGFRGIKYLAARDVYSVLCLSEWDELPAAESFCRIRLPRLPGAELRVLDESGSPLADSALMVLDGDGHHVVRTDGDGNASIPARYDSGELTITRLAPDPGPGAYGFASSTEKTTFRLGGSDWPQELAVGRVRFVWSDDGAGVTPIEGLQVTHVDGWVDFTDEDGWVELPAGAAYVVADDASPHAPLGSPPVFVIEDETALVELQRRSRRVFGSLPAGLVSRVVVECGAHSTTHEFEDAEPFEITLTGSEPCTLWFPEREVTIKHDPQQEPYDPDAIAVMLSMSDELDVEHRPRAAWTLTIPEEVSVGLGGPSAHECNLRADAGQVKIEGPTSTPLLLQFSREGHTDRWARALLAVGADAPAVPELPRLASLRIESNTDFEVEGIDGSEDPLALHPGPFDCVVRLFDGRRVALQLELAPGEQRVLRLK